MLWQSYEKTLLETVHSKPYSRLPPSGTNQKDRVNYFFFQEFKYAKSAHSGTWSYGLVGYDDRLTRDRSLVRFRVVPFFLFFFNPNKINAVPCSMISLVCVENVILD